MITLIFNHVVLCGYGECGAAALSNILASECPPEAITVVDIDHKRALAATRRGVRVIVGDATIVATLYAAHVGAAHSVVVCIAPDAAAVALVRLARDLAPLATIAVAIWETKAEPLALAAGADTVVALQQLAGRLAAQAVLDVGGTRPRV